jgi:nicotinamidase-related amidase
MAALDFTAPLETKRTAIIMIEFQFDFCKEGGKLHEACKASIDATGMIGNTVSLVEAARAKGVKIIHAPILFSDDYKELGSTSYGILANVKAGGCFLASGPGGEIIPELAPQSNDLVVKGKTGLCAFASTNLDFVLRQNGIETIAICGFLTNCCVESTMRTAYEKGYNVITVTDCCAATSIEQHDAACNFTFPMFSVPMVHTVLIEKIASS